MKYVRLLYVRKLHYIRGPLAGNFVISHCMQIFLILLPFSSASVVKYIGCMTSKMHASEVLKLEMQQNRNKEEEIRYKDLPRKRGAFIHLVGDYSGMTVQVCVQRCWVKRFSFASIQEAQRCFCGSHVEGMVKVNPTLCYLRCSGNCRQRCGGHIALSVFDTGYEREPPLTPAPLDSGKLDCWVDNDPIRLCSDVMKQLVTPRMTPLLCTTYCHNHHYSLASFKDPNTCCCNRYTQHLIDKVVRLSVRIYCSTPCSGDESSSCVGKDPGRHVRTSVVYHLGLFAGMERLKPISDNEIWMWPEWPAKDQFEQDEFRPHYKGGLNAPDIALPNTGVQVVDEPIFNTKGKAVVAVVVLCCLLLAASIAGNIYHRKHLSPKRFNFSDKVKKIKPKTRQGRSRKRPKSRSRGEDRRRPAKRSRRNSPS